MRVLSLGTDRSIVNPKSESRKRQIVYGSHFDEMNLILCMKGKEANAKITLAAGIHVYPTQSRSRLWYGVDALRTALYLGKHDVVTAQDVFETGFVAWLIAKMHGSTLHVQVHTDFLAPSFGNSFLNSLRLLLAGFVLKRADRIRVVSYKIQESIQKKYTLRVPIVVLPIFTDVLRFQNAFPGELAHRFRHFNIKLLVVARLEKEKNVMLALTAFANVAPTSACLMIVGDGRERKVLEQKASEKGISGRVFFEGTQDPAPYYALADITLVPSLYEGYGNVIIESLAARKPVLANDVGIAREAGALITDSAHFEDALHTWFEEGPKTGALQHYPYASFEDYVAAYVADIKASA